MRKLLVILLALFMLIGCSQTVKPVPKPDPKPSPDPEPDPQPDPIVETDPAKELLDTLTLEEKVGQLFVVRLEVLCEDKTQAEKNAYRRNGAKELDESMIAVLNRYHLGGFVLFGKNLLNPEQLINLNQQIRKNCKIVPFITIDEEGGQVGRIAWNENFEVTTFPLLYDYFADGDTARAFLVGNTIGTYLREYGFNAVFAPVADVFTNPDNTVIGKRAFGSDPHFVSNMISACLDGFHEQGVMTTLKHYPGHGDTSSDTHNDTVNTSKTWEQMEECELIPFVENLDNTEMIMAAHITVKGDSDPASLSYNALTERLRNKYGYKGLIITDALDMGAISSHYTSEEAAVKAFLAGCDILLMPANFNKAYNAIIDAVNSGTITMERLDESVLRILRYKLSNSLSGE